MKETKLNYESMFQHYPDVMSVKDVMSALGVCKHSVYELIDSGKLNSFRIGRTHKIPKCVLISYIIQSNVGTKANDLVV